MSYLRESIEAYHARIHEGKAFMTHHNSSSLGSGSTINIYLQTAATPDVHMIYNATGSAAFDLEVLESPTATSNTGTNGVAIYNKDRNSGTTSTLKDNATSPASNKVGRNVTITANGTIIRSDVFGSNKGGGNYDGKREIILKASTKYVFRLTSRAAGNRVHINLDWYEN